MADAARDGEAQEGSSPYNIDAFSFRTGREPCRASCQVQRGDTKNRYNITPFPLGCVNEQASKRLRHFLFVCLFLDDCLKAFLTATLVLHERSLFSQVAGRVPEC